MVCFGSAISHRCTSMAAGLASIREGRQTEMISGLACGQPKTRPKQ